MENCLNTKLKESVNNNDLMILGKLSIYTLPAEGHSWNFNITASEDVTVTAPDGVYIGTSSSTINKQQINVAANTDQKIYISSANAKVLVSSLYAITAVKIVASAYTKINIDSLSANVTRLELSNSPSDGNLSFLKSQQLLEILKIDGTNVTGDISHLRNNTSLTNVKLNSYVYGKIDNLGPLTNLIWIEARNNTHNLGTIEGFVAGQKANGRNEVTTSNAIRADYMLLCCTFGGKNYDDARWHITWDDHKIVLYTGAAAIGNCTKLYAKGATTEEITAWEQAGKTVVVVN